jgi:hypothetical protein
MGNNVKPWQLIENKTFIIKVNYLNLDFNHGQNFWDWKS